MSKEPIEYEVTVNDSRKKIVAQTPYKAALKAAGRFGGLRAGKSGKRLFGGQYWWYHGENLDVVVKTKKQAEAE